MANDFETRIADYVVSASDTAAMTDYLTSGAAVIVDKLPIAKALINATKVTDAGSGISIIGNRLLSAHKSDRDAPLVEPGMIAQVKDILSVWYATTKSPKSYILAAKLYIVPGGGDGIVVPYPTVLYTATSISSFPSELVEAVVLYAAIRSLHQIMNAEMITNMDAITLTMPTAPTAPSAPDYPEGLILNASVSAVTVGALDNVPIYLAGAPTKPVFVVASGTVPTALATPSITYADASVASVVIQPILDISARLTTLTTYLDTDKDPELSQVKIQEIQALISEFQSKSTSATSILGKNADRETDVNKQNANQELSQDIQQYSATVSRYNAELGKYREDINKQVQEHSLNLQAFVRDSTSQMFDALNEFNKANSVYQSETQQKFEQAKTTAQEALQDARLTQDANKEQAFLQLSKEHQEYASKLQKYSAEINNYQAETNDVVQEFNSKIGQVNQKHEGLLQQMGYLQKLYDNELQLHLG